MGEDLIFLLGGNKPHVKYLTLSDGQEYEFYQSQTPPFGQVPEGFLDSDVDQFMELLEHSMAGRQIVTQHGVLSSDV